MSNERVEIPTSTLEMVAYILRCAGEESAAGLETLEHYKDADKDTVERQAYNNLNQIDSLLAVADGFFADLFGDELWRLYEDRGQERWAHQ